MIKVIKYKIVTLLEDKYFLALLIIFFLILNYNVLLDSGLTSIGSRDFNADIKYALLINNFTVAASLYGLIVAVYIGTGIIGKDVNTGQIYTLLITYPKRWKYFLGCWVGLFILTTGFILMILVNYFCVGFALDIKTVYNDLYVCFKDIYLNMLVVMSITAVASIFINGIASAFAGFIGIVIYNIYAFMQIPLINRLVEISYNTRRVLVCIVPLIDTEPPSLSNTGLVRGVAITPYIIHNLNIYQLIYSIVLVSLGCFFFKKRQL